MSLNLLRTLKKIPQKIEKVLLQNDVFKKNYSPSEPGSGAGRGGGAGGSIRESGGGLGKYGAANEEGYFFNKQKEQLRKLKSRLKKDDKSPSIEKKQE